MVEGVADWRKERSLVGDCLLIVEFLASLFLGGGIRGCVRRLRVWTRREREREREMGRVEWVVEKRKSVQYGRIAFILYVFVNRPVYCPRQPGTSEVHR